MSKKLISVCENALESILAAKEMELVDIEMKKEGSRLVLRAYVDLLEGGVNLNQLEEVSRELSKKLDELYTEDTPYVLELSSPGVERVLKKDRDFVRFAGKSVDVKLFAPVDGKKHYTGVLIGRNERGLTVVLDGEEKFFENSAVSKVNLHFEF